jgi:hypothetical protein
MPRTDDDLARQPYFEMLPRFLSIEAGIHRNSTIQFLGGFSRRRERNSTFGHGCGRERVH